MKLNNFWIEYMEIEDTCPVCGQVTSNDMGTSLLGNLPEVEEFWCHNEEHGSWKKTINWAELIGEAYERYKEKSYES